MPKEAIQFYYKSTCSTCRNARKFLLDKKIQFTERDYKKDPLSERELSDLIGKRDISLFLNTRNELVQELEWKKYPPTREEFIRKAMQEPNVIKRPIFQKGDKLIMGFDEESVKKLAR